MILEITLDNIDILQTEFLNSSTVKNDFKVNPFGHYLVYLNKEETILGYLYYSEIYERVEINQIEVLSSNRNCGIATELLKYLTEHVNKNITLEVKKDNECAIHLYHKFGFQKIGIRKGYYAGIDGILMERSVEK